MRFVVPVDIQFHCAHYASRVLHTKREAQGKDLWIGCVLFVSCNEVVEVDARSFLGGNDDATLKRREARALQDAKRSSTDECTLDTDSF